MGYICAVLCRTRYVIYTMFLRWKCSRFHKPALHCMVLHSLGLLILSYIHHSSVGLLNSMVAADFPTVTQAGSEAQIAQMPKIEAEAEAIALETLPVSM